MKITRIEILPVSIPIQSPKRVAFGLFDMRAYVFVKVYTDEGIVGVGETSPWIPETRESQEDIIPLIEKWLGPAIIGEDPFEIQSIWKIMERIHGRVAAKGAIDIALYDILGKALGLPIYRLLGGPCFKRLPLASIVGLDEPEKMAEDALSQIKAYNVKGLRLKLGSTIREDEARFKAVREAVGTAMSIRIDLNGHYNSSDAITLVKRLEDYDLTLVEQPVPWHDIQGLKRVNERVDTLVQPDESYYTCWDLSHLMVMGAASVLGLKMVRPGGFTSNKKVIDMAELLNIPCYINSAGEMGVAKAAALHFAFHHNNIKFPCEINVYRESEEDMIVETFETEDGYALAPKGPGLGVTLDEKRLHKFLGEVKVCSEKRAIVNL
ncbi:MAG: mandelate racemase/muconate lactonizing enzyme family protein [Desulfobacterota bacterium]|nr:mandelate racemase/muconate lactonizing enzyme family protein [Thermodesulfobacteriota bacterium]